MFRKDAERARMPNEEDMNPDSLIDGSSVAAVVSDPRRPDNPIVACNQAFIDLTGYAREEILGRNCRFLRGPRTEAERTQALRDAVAAARPAMVELVNYRHDGTPFRNAVMIAPLFGDDGQLMYFLGSQIAIDDAAVDRATAARSRLDKLSPRQRQVVQGLARGRLNKQIAHDLGLSERTIKMHRSAMLRGMDVRTVAEAIRIAIEGGL